MYIRVKRLDPNAKLPTVAHPFEDLGYDLYALDFTLINAAVAKVRTGIAIQFASGYGGIIKDRSSMAAKGIFTHAGVVDAGYRGEIIVLMTSLRDTQINPGDKIAQIVPVRAATGEVIEAYELDDSYRGEKGFGSSGR